MARGNDAAAAAAEFRGQYGLTGNAEDLIQANRSAYPAELRAASLLPVNEPATNELDLEGLGGKLDIGDESRVLDAAVRGDQVIAVVETQSGHIYKQVLSTDDAGVDLGQVPRGMRYHTPRNIEDPAFESIQAQVRVNQIIAQARVEAEQIIQDAREQAQQEAAEKAQSAIQEAQEEAQQEAEQQAQEAEQEDKPVRGRGAQSGAASTADKETAKEQARKPS